MDNFLPDNYEAPQSEGGYMKLVSGENRFRIMSSAVVGMERWVNKKPVRTHMEDSITVAQFEESDKDQFTGEPRMPKHFWAFVVWNYKLEKLQILEIDKKTIQKQITDIVTKKAWGSPVGTDGYDLVITKEGELKETKYSVVPEPKEKLDEKIVSLYKRTSIDLEELFKGGNPFGEVKSQEYQDVKDILG